MAALIQSDAGRPDGTADPKVIELGYCGVQAFFTWAFHHIQKTPSGPLTSNLKSAFVISAGSLSKYGETWTELLGFLAPNAQFSFADIPNHRVSVSDRQHALKLCYEVLFDVKYRVESPFEGNLLVTGASFLQRAVSFKIAGHLAIAAASMTNSGILHICQTLQNLCSESVLEGTEIPADLTLAFIAGSESLPVRWLRFDLHTQLLDRMWRAIKNCPEINHGRLAAKTVVTLWYDAQLIHRITRSD